ncbi:MAG TPA: extracellular solute-binding protein [Gaiellales bacterium]|nr:extracellular solute-binding protein [Gaiellales bacterium]
MRTTRREFLAVAASGILATACSPQLGADNGAQTIATSTSGLPSDQVLEPDLRVVLPPGTVAPSTFASFTHQTGVRPRVSAWPGDARLQLDLAAGLQGKVDVVLLGEDAVSAQVALAQVEALDRSLLPNLRNLEPPFASPPYDPGSRHSVGFDYQTVGIALAPGVRLNPPATWQGLFGLVQLLPGSVAVPDDPAIVVGAALVARGHDWSSDSGSDLDDASQLLQSLRGALVVGGPLATVSLGANAAAIVSSATANAAADRYVVPLDGTVASLRSFCIPLYAPAPVAAHAWLNHVLDPVTAAADVTYSRLGTPLRGASYLVSPTLLVDQSVFPPPRALAKLTLPNISDAGLVARTALWSQVKA